MKMLCQVYQVVVGACVGVVGFGLQKNRLSREQRGSSIGLYLPLSSTTISSGLLCVQVRPMVLFLPQKSRITRRK